jgi:hypothetical protein
MVLFKFAILCVDYILYIDTHILVLLKLLTYLSVSPCLVVILITVPSYLHIVLYIQYINDEAGTILLSTIDRGLRTTGLTPLFYQSCIF